jgi:hypothetical protein
MTMNRTIATLALAGTLAACGAPAGGSGETGTEAAALDTDAGPYACRIGFVFPDGDAGKWSGGYYSLAQACPAVVSGNEFELATGNSAYDGWQCWGYGPGEWCCAPDASSKSICDSQLR